MRRLEYLMLQIIMVLIVLLNLNHSYSTMVDSSSLSFVYCYGNAKIWVFIETNRTLDIGPNTSSTILLAVYLEKLGNNIGVFLNRVTFKFEGMQLEKTLSPNVTLQNTLRSWSCNITFEQGDISSILSPGQMLSGEMNFEFRYDVIDSSGEFWSYRVSENFPVRFVNVGQIEISRITFEIIFITVSLFGIVSAMVLLWLKIRWYKRKTQANVNLAK